MTLRYRLKARWNNPEAALPQTLPREVLDRVGRVLEYHDLSKQTYDQVHRSPPALDWANRPNAFRTFNNLPKVDLPTTILDLPAPMMHVLTEGMSAVPESHVRPPQDLKSLASWLYFAYGLTEERQAGPIRYWLRTCPSAGSLYPCEIYVAALGVQGLEPGLYHYCPRGFHLRKLREGPTALAQIKKGRPDLDFLKNIPAALLVSTIFCRSSWLFRQRAYRAALTDAGHLAQNLITTAYGLGIPTTTRLRLNSHNMHELIGVPHDAPFAEAEAVQAMVVWADEAKRPMAATPSTNGKALNGGSGAFSIGGASLPPIPRQPLAERVVPYGSILAVHEDCVAPGVAVRDVRPPWTELSPLPDEAEPVALPMPERFVGGPSVRHVVEHRRNAGDFMPTGIPRQAFWLMNRVAFRGGSHPPIHTSGMHVGLVRALWLVNDVAGMNPGLWHYEPGADEPGADQWFHLRYGDLRRESQYLCLEQPACGEASAVCFLLADLPTLMKNNGPDLYRLAHLEAGLVAQRLILAAEAMGVGSCLVSGFYDDDARTFLSLRVGQPGWEPLYALAVGQPLARERDI